MRIKEIFISTKIITKNFITHPFSAIDKVSLHEMDPFSPVTISNS